MERKGSHGAPKIVTRELDYDPKEMSITITTRVRKISRKRFIGLAMYHGFSARVARDMADVVLAHGASYTKGYLLLRKAVNETVMKAAAEAKNAELDKMVNGCAETSEALG